MAASARKDYDTQTITVGFNVEKATRVIARHVEAHTAPVVEALQAIAKINIDSRLAALHAKEQAIQALAGQPTPPAPQAVSRTAYELAGQFTYGGNDYDAAAKLIQQALEAQHAKTWAMAIEAASLKSVTDEHQDLVRALPCPPLEQEGR